MAQNGRSDELAFDRRRADECRRRHERIAERGKTHEPNAEQDQRRAGRADIGNVIERHGYEPQDDRVWQAEQPRPERDHYAQAKVDDRHGGDVSRKMLLDVIGDADEAELALAGGEERRHIPAEIDLRGKKEDERHEEQSHSYQRRRDEGQDRRDDG